MKPVVYISSPYSEGDQALNVRFQCQVFDKLFDSDLVWPVAPLWSHFQHMLCPRDYEDWIEYDLAMIDRYDACLRLPATIEAISYKQVESAGADREVAEFTRQGKPVFTRITELYRWAKKWKPPQADEVQLSASNRRGAGRTGPPVRKD